MLFKRLQLIVAMATSPILLGEELQNQQAEITKENLSDMLTSQKCWECLDKIDYFSSNSGIVASFTAHNIMGRTYFTEPVLPQIDDVVCIEDKNDGKPAFAQHRIIQEVLPINLDAGIFCQDNLTGIFISHTSNNSHCERDDQLAVSLPTIKELDWWYGSGIMQHSVLGVLSRIGDQKNIIICTAGMRQNTLLSNNPAWSFCGPGPGLSAKNQIGAMEQEGIKMTAVVYDNVFDYNRQIKQAINVLTPSKV
jgi:hypothetical protein